MDRPPWVAAMLSLPAHLFRVWMYLWWRQGRNDCAWPAQETMAQDLGLTQQRIRDITRELQRRGWLEILEPPRQGRGNYLRYVVIGPAEGSNPLEPFDEKGSNEFEPSGTKRVKSMREKGSSGFGANTIQETHTPTMYRNPELPPQAIETFTPPTVAQVQEYATVQGYSDFGANQFVAYYNNTQWRDKGGRPIGSWKQKVTAWMQRNKNRAQSPACGSLCAELTTREFSEEEADALFTTVESRS